MSREGIEPLFNPPRLLDLFCGAGGAAMGYWRAGFDVTGVDIVAQPHYPFTFHQADAMTFPLDGYDVIHASPPCQTYSAMSACRPGLSDDYPDLIDAVRDRLIATGVPWVIENVEGAPLVEADNLFGEYGIMLCGRMFGLDLYRHRLFESNRPLTSPPHNWHDVSASKAGHWTPGTIMSVSGHCAPIEIARAAMGVDWPMPREGLAEAIPPAYTEHIGAQLMGAVIANVG